MENFESSGSGKTRTEKVTNVWEGPANRFDKKKCCTILSKQPTKIALLFIEKKKLFVEFCYRKTRRKMFFLPPESFHRFSEWQSSKRPRRLLLRSEGQRYVISLRLLTPRSLHLALVTFLEFSASYVEKNFYYLVRAKQNIFFNSTTRGTTTREAGEERTRVKVKKENARWSENVRKTPCEILYFIWK